MIIRSKLTPGLLKSIKQGDIHELFICDANSNNKVVKLLIKIEGFIKEAEKCNACGIILKGNDREEFMKKVYCSDCAKRKKEEKSKLSMGHPQHKNPFGGTVFKIKV